MGHQRPCLVPATDRIELSVLSGEMKIFMWSAVEGDAEYDEDNGQGVMAVISQSVPDDVKMTIATAPHPQWQNLSLTIWPLHIFYSR